MPSNSATDGYRIKLYRGLWCAVWREGGTTRRSSLGTADRALADRRYSEFLHRLRTPPKPQAVTIDAIIAAYRADRVGAGVPVARLDFAWKRLSPKFANCAPDHITKPLCRQYTAERRESGVSDGTIRRELGVLATALNWAEGEKWFDVNGVPGRAPIVVRPAPPPPRERWLSHEEGRQLVDASVAAHLRLFIILALYTAARTGAILELTWAQVNERFIDFKPPGASVRRKGRAVVPMNPVLWAALEEARKASVSPYVVEFAGGRVKSIKTGFRATCIRAGLAGVSPHVLRHTAATWMAEKGVEIRKIALYLGHTDTETTERIYAKHSPGYLADGAAAVMAALDDPAATPTINREKLG